MESLFIGILVLVLGGAVAMYGTRLFYLLLPVWGFLFGFVLGAQLFSAIFGDGFLATVAGWGVGLVTGIVFGVIAGIWYWASIVLLAGGVGWIVGDGLFDAIGMADGILPIVGAAVVAAVFAIVAIVIDAPTLLVVVLTSIGGSAYSVAGVLLVLGLIGKGDMEHGAIGALSDFPLAVAAWLLFAAVALGYQLLEARARSTDLRGRLDQPTAV
jgi:hypothetical protein